MTPFDLTQGIPRPVGVADLYQSKTRAKLRRSFGGKFPGAGRIGLVIRVQNHEKVCNLESAQLETLDRVTISRADVIRDDLQQFAPLIGRKHFVPFHVDMIPESSFGASLENILTERCWKEIRGAAFKKAGYVCEICGEANGPVEGHELWHFDDGCSDKRGWAIQRLKAILCLCRECHEMFHPGLANIRGRGDAVASRRMAINEWSPAEYQRAVNSMDRLHKARSRRNWVLDFSNLPFPGFMEINGAWQVHQSEFLIARTKHGRAATRLLGGSFRLANGMHIDRNGSFLESTSMEATAR